MNILYFITRWEVGSAYKNITLMQENFGGHIVRDSVSEAFQYIRESRPEFVVVRGDGRKDYLIAMKARLPYLLIENDISSMRRELNSKMLEEERYKIEHAAAIILTSEEHASYLKERYKLPHYRVIHTRPLKKDLNFDLKPKTSSPSLVYAGGIASQWSQRTSPYGYRCYHQVLKAFVDSGWEVHLYPASYRKLSEYKDFGCIIHNKLSYNDLLKEISQYTAGLHSYNREGVPEKAYNYTQSCRGNKIWDYLAAGIPTVGYQGGRGMDIYRNKWGVVIRSLSRSNLLELPKRLGKIEITNEMRFENTMDNDLDVYRELVDVVLKESKSKEAASLPTIPLWKSSDIVIQVTNKRPTVITRGNRVFEPYKTTEPFVVSKGQWREIKAHVGLKISYVQGV